MINHNSTICALSTAPGIGAIGIIRLSGEKSKSITQKICSINLSLIKAQETKFSRIVNGEKIVDEVMITFFHGPHSYTGEDVIEITCHGSPYIISRIIELLVQNGAKLAQAGEFTLRAFMNGKMDLAQAEAVSDLIASQTRNAHEIAMKQMRGGVSTKLKLLREKLLDFASLIELELDFSEEDVEFANRKELITLVSNTLVHLNELEQTFDLGNAIKNGVPVTIAGAPNVGKSTLLNRLIGEEKAIVSNIPGTTRDFIEDTITINGIQFRLIDTAGIRDDGGEIEKLGIERTKQKIADARIVLYLCDAGEDASAQEGHKSVDPEIAREGAERLKRIYPDKIIAVVANKIELRIGEIRWKSKLPLIQISARMGRGVDELKDWLYNQVCTYDIMPDVIISNQRHLNALKEAKISLEDAKAGLENKLSGDLIAPDIRQALYHIGSITGEISTEDILGNIFGKFCIGK